MQYYDQNGSNSGGGVKPQPYAPNVPVTQPGYIPPGVQPVNPIPSNVVPPQPAMVHTAHNNFQDPKVKVPDRKSVATKMVEVVYTLTIILESALALRFVFKLLGGSSVNTFLRLLYDTTEVFTFPFQNMFGYSAQNSVRVSNYNLEFTTLVAIGIYALVAFIIVKIIDIFR